MANLFWTEFSLVSLCSSLLVIGLFWVWEKNRKKRKLKGTVVVKLRDDLEMDDGSEVDPNRSLKWMMAHIQLISATKADSSGNGHVGKLAHVDGVFDDNHSPNKDKQYTFTVYFDYDKRFGIPGAFFIKNFSPTEFFLISLTLEDIPNHANIHFVCNSWICNEKKYQSDRIFFANNTYLPSKTPLPLVNYRELELKALRGDGTGERKEGERIYDYDIYNDLGNPDEDASLARPIAGGSKAYPYPRRGRTGRKPTLADPKSEGRSEYVYIPRDEDVVHLKFKSLIQKLKALSEGVNPEQAIKFIQDEFQSFDDVFNLYNDRGGHFPVPTVIKANKTAWMTDEEFAREVIAGLNPCLIRRVHELPQKSKLHSGEQKECKLDGLMTIDEAIKDKRLFVLDHYKTIMPYLRRINSNPTTKAYASRTYFYLRDDGTLKPVFIELSLPNPKGDEFDVDSQVYVPETEGIEGSKWLLAKAYVIVNDTCHHQLISHWLHTHAVVEPFVIATNRQLSVVHPIYKLLHPHFRNTMNINAAARQILVNATGIIENTFLWGKYAVEISSINYKDWVFPEQALPADLIKRGMAVEDPMSPNGVKLVIEDYPYAVDGLDIWSAIKTWVQEYVFIYYTSNEIVQQDSELKSWWKEIVEVGHGDKKDEKWWSKMKTREELIEACSIIIWTASALHAAVNFGQYPYGGVILNRPSISRRFMPEEGTEEYNELVENREWAYLKTITQKGLAIIDLTVLEILSTHSANEYYLGQRESSEYWTSDTKTLKAFNKFGKALSEIEKKISERNEDKTLKNRIGPVNMPYTMLYPSSEEGMTFKGIPNSISI